MIECIAFVVGCACCGFLYLLFTGRVDEILKI